MRRVFRGKMCAYCAVTKAATDDHVLAREFVAIEKRGNLPIVPACEPCNRRKQRLENDLLAVLPFGAVHTGAGDNLETLAAPRLEKIVAFSVNSQPALRLSRAYVMIGPRR
jgi:hypothetical protein